MNLTVKIGKTTFNNPIWVASGTFGSGKEFRDFLDIEKIGAIITKTITLEGRKGNPSPRLAETASGLLNSIGLENKGVCGFVKDNKEFLSKLRTRVVVSVAGATKAEFEECVLELSKRYKPDAIELNLSCPNVAHKGGKHALFSQDENITREIISAIRKKTKTTLIAKLTPNVTDISAIAKAAEDGGADAVSLVNTYLGMAVDAETMKPRLGNVIGGLSGPAIKPLALKAVWDSYRKIKIPIVGIGGIMTGEDVAEFMLCGAAAVQLGTVNFVDPEAPARVLAELAGYLKRKKITKASELVGRLKHG